MLLLRLVGWRDKFRAAAEESWARTSTVLGYRHEDLIDPHVGPNPDVSTVRIVEGDGQMQRLTSDAQNAHTPVCRRNDVRVETAVVPDKKP
jgi:hypothetical protein